MSKNKITESDAKELIKGKLSRYFGVTPSEATKEQIYKAVVMSVRDIMLEKRQLFHNEMKAKKEMLRVVKNKEGEVFIDFTGKAAGRGAYLCDRPDCVKKLKKARLLNKTFSCEIPDSVYERIEEEFFAKK